MIRLDLEFEHLRKYFEFGSDRLSIRFSPKTIAKYDFLPMNFRCRGLYLARHRQIVLPSRRGGRYRLFVLLHELAHALQHRDNRLDSSNVVVRYENEVEANSWAAYQYCRVYRRKYGPLPAHCFRMPDYEYFKTLWQIQEGHGR